MLTSSFFYKRPLCWFCNLPLSGRMFYHCKKCKKGPYQTHQFIFYIDKHYQPVLKNWCILISYRLQRSLYGLFLSRDADDMYVHYDLLIDFSWKANFIFKKFSWIVRNSKFWCCFGSSDFWWKKEYLGLANAAVFVFVRNIPAIYITWLFAWFFFRKSNPSN